MPPASQGSCRQPLSSNTNINMNIIAYERCRQRICIDEINLMTTAC